MSEIELCSESGLSQEKNFSCTEKKVAFVCIEFYILPHSNNSKIVFPAAGLVKSYPKAV